MKLIPKFQTPSGPLKPNVFRTPSGQYVNDKNEQLTVLNKLGLDDESQWTYTDSKGNIYTPHREDTKQATLSQDNNAWTKQQIQKALNTRTWRSDAADFFHTLGEAAMADADLMTLGEIPALRTAATKGFKYMRNVPNWAKKFKENMTFKSELDWSPEGWFEKTARRPYNDGSPEAYTDEDVAFLKKHIHEYHKIERKAKANGTWLKMPDGSTWTGDPRSWVQLQSKDGQKLAQKRLFTGVNNLPTTTGIPKSEAFPTYEGDVWTADSYKHAQPYSQLIDFDLNGNVSYDIGKTFEITYPKKSKILEVDANEQLWGDIDLRKAKGLSTVGNNNDYLVITDDIVKEAKRKGYDITKIDNVIEGQGKLTNDAIIHENVPRKSIIGNNGNFNLKYKNIYRMLIPTILGSTYVGSLNENK